MSKMKIAILAVLIVAAAVWLVRVYQVNEGVAKKYQIRTYQVGQNVPFGNATLNVKSLTYGRLTNNHGFKTIPATVTMQIRNTSTKNISILKIVEAKLAYGLDYYQTMSGNFNKSELLQLQPSHSTTVILRFSVKPNHKGERPKIYFDQNLYAPLVLKEYKKGIRYGIGVQF
ncbi:hypothetical protein E4665_13590 [Sporolactobacillus shoreae]|uniref:DUF4352 domain-containing protein n=1 Tax=Sporolactobacillus shoreae TaxID=1465501 RepID=A0A4Z0GLE8_9BACL|nr:hypothetical protein [Sporolactobacillus shoreae]TGA96890.1 hypothetical protein E4665_13590 [Sporolactobacillus shoreae]